jgi:hypothetical protein
MRKLRAFSLISLILMLAITGTQAFAECDYVSTNYWVCSGTFLTNVYEGYDTDETFVVTAGTTFPGNWISGGGGNDTMINNGTMYGVLAGENGSNGITDGDDIIINNGSILNCALYCNAGMVGGFGNDTLSNNGLLEGIMSGGAGGDILVNRGTIQQDIYGDATGVLSPVQECVELSGNSTIINSGTVGGTIWAGCLNDTVALEPGANGGSDNYLLIKGETGDDTLVLSFEDAAVDAAVLANASSGSVTIDGQTFAWVDFEHIVKGQPEDGRLNGGVENNARTAAVYCSEYEDGGVIVYGIDENAEGYLLFSVSSEDAHAALQAAHDGGEHVMIAEEDGQSLWALTSNELQIHDADGTYNFIFSPTVCGIPLAD